MTKTMYSVVAGAVPTQILNDFTQSESTELVLEDVTYIPAAPNHVTIKDDSDSFVTVSYTTITGTTLSGLDYVEGDKDHLFEAGSYAARVYDNYDHEAFIDNINAKLNASQGVAHYGKVMAVNASGNVVPTEIDISGSYNNLTDKPQINSVTLTGNKSGDDLGLVDKVSGKGLSTNDYTDADKSIVDSVTTELSNKVDKVTGKGLSTNDFTTAEKTKLASIADGAEVNVQSDWSTTATDADSYIKNKPSTMPNPQSITFTGASTGTYDGSSALTINIPESTSTTWGSIGGTLSNQTDLNIALSGKQGIINSTNKLSADLVDDTTTTNKFVTSADKSAWNGKQNLIDSGNKLSADYVDDTSTTNKFFHSHASTHESGGNDELELAQSQITGLTAELSGKEPAFTKNTAFNKNFGSTSGTVCEGNDSRLSDARAPTNHALSHSSNGSDAITIAESQVTNLTTDLAGKVDKQYTAAQDNYIAKVDPIDHVLKVMSAGTTQVAWGDISGTLSNQSDLNAALSGKLGTQYSSAQDGYIAKVDSTDHVLKVMAAGTSSVAFADITGSPSDNTALNNSLNAKQNVINSSNKLSADFVSETSTNKFNVQSDWNSSGGLSEILNKPSTFSPSAHASSHASGGSDAITIAESQVTNLTTDLAGKQPLLTFDDVPTSGSTNPVKSSGIYAHTSDTSNPHSVTKAQVGLGNTVDGAQINVIEEVQKNGTPLTIVNKSVNLVLSKTDVGLGNVDNTSDLNKPISTATQTALDGKVSTTSQEMTKLASLNTVSLIVSSSTSVSASSFEEQIEPDVTGYPYRALISVTEMTSDFFVAVVYSQTDAISGNLSNVCVSTNGGVYIYSKTQPTLAVVVESISAWKTL